MLLWMAEAQAIKGGEFPTPAQITPEEAVALRKQWRDRMGPLKAALASVQSAYVEKCVELEKVAETDAAREALRERREEAVVFRNFLALCGGRAPPFPRDPVTGSEPE
ncbi:MAG: hypothetical protein GWO24_25680, partial [Akkermansiaceae bacterium]|nr:hypothetical protein [Akkermansiaceae bacterium]